MRSLWLAEAAMQETNNGNKQKKTPSLILGTFLSNQCLKIPRLRCVFSVVLPAWPPANDGRVSLTCLWPHGGRGCRRAKEEEETEPPPTLRLPLSRPALPFNLGTTPSACLVFWVKGRAELFKHFSAAPLKPWNRVIKRLGMIKTRSEKKIY